MEKECYQGRAFPLVEKSQATTILSFQFLFYSLHTLLSLNTHTHTVWVDTCARAWQH